MAKILLICLLLFNGIRATDNYQETDDKYSLNIYHKFNNYETVIKIPNFIINVTEKSYAYFDSFDRNANFWISNNYDDMISEKDERITAQFIQIEPNITYFIRSQFWNLPSVVKKYLYPIKLDEKEINISDDKEEINFLYLEKNKNYTLNFEENTIKKMIKLSHKTYNSKIKIFINDVEEAELNENEHYYHIPENFTDKIKLEISENNALLEFLSDFGDYQILKDISFEKQEIDKNIVIINIQKTQKMFDLSLTSNETFNCSFSYGLSNISNYYYFSKHNTKITPPNKSNVYTGNMRLAYTFKDITLSKNEFISFAIILEARPNQKIYLNYYQTPLFEEFTELLEEKISEENCTKLIDNLKNIFEIYVYTDIAKNPPNIKDYPNYHHKPIDIKEELDKVSKVNRTFYDFYQEIQKIICSLRDQHLSVSAFETPNGKQFSAYKAHLPFNYQIRKDINGKYKVFIIKNNYYYRARQEIKDQIDSVKEIPLKKINNLEPFEYIQNWSKYTKTKNDHAQFSYIIEIISDFNLRYFPVDCYDLENEYEFENNKLFIFYYYFDNFYLGENEDELYKYSLNKFKNQNTFSKFPSFSDIEEEFLISKGLKQKKQVLKNEEINWDILYEETKGRTKYLKCRVDEKNKVNVFVQNSFGFNYDRAAEKSLECARLFYSNEYPLIIILDHNDGGNLFLSQLLVQILQIKIANRRYESFRLTEISKEYFNNIKWEVDRVDLINQETCEIIKSFSDIEETTDHYNYNNLDIEHKRTKMIERFSTAWKNYLNTFREEYFNSTKVKNPTEIIVFTDSYSFSSASGFIKDFQNNGGAIVVGYYGNPMKDGLEFDGSQSHSGVHYLKETTFCKNLEELGFTIDGVTVSEFYDDFREENPIPREYTMNPVDYRVDIYSPYSDDIYEQFINKGLEVSNLFNNGTYCNGKNERLLLHDDNCKIIEGDQYAHGGYKCNRENKWNKEKCEVYYCDIGYYYDRHEKKCMKDCSFDENKKQIYIYEKEYNKTFMIEPNMTYVFETLYNDNYYYFIETSEESLNDDPKILFLTSFQNVIVKNNNNKAIKIKIKSVNPNINPGIKNIPKTVGHLEINEISFSKGKNMYFIQSLDDSSFYIKNYLNLSNSEIKMAKYKENMNYDEIIRISPDYFSDVLDNIYPMEKNKPYIIYLNNKEYEEINFYFTRKNNETIEISDSKNILFLEKNRDYTLDFSNYNFKNLMIKLSRKTINAEITLVDENIKLNSKNLYYNLTESFKDKLNIKIGNEDALIEILVKQSDELMEIINLYGKNELNITKKFTFIQIPKNYTYKDMKFRLNKEGNSIVYIYHDYSKEGYSLYYPINQEQNSIVLNNLTFNIVDHYKGDTNLMENEFYYLFIQTNETDSNINIFIEYKDNEPSNPEGSSGLKAWQIVLIVLGCILFVVLIIILVIFLRRKKNAFDISNEEKIRILTELQ